MSGRAPDPDPGPEPERRAALLAAKLRVLAATGAGAPGDAETATFPGGAALHAGGRGWVLAEDRPQRALGPALAWARRNGVSDLQLLAAGAAGLLARRAALFRVPPRVWAIEGTGLVAAVPAPLDPPARLDPRAAALAEVIAGAGADPVVERGVLVGEVAGLEVARVVVEADEVRLQVGVGRHDREAFQQLHGDRPTAEALAGVVATVRRHRVEATRPHPLHRLAAERALRARIIARPGLVGAAHLVPVDPPVARTNLKEPVPAVAGGTDPAGRPMVVVTSVGIDLDLVPFAADARLADGRGARLVLAVPARDAHPITRELAGALVEPAEVVTVERSVP
ncbi:MAG: hypothetical protein IPM45_06875 [Acidimicrobiales bacterium]|nr:hypothetical protein [Acidimicrobiales bacterium]